MLRPKMLIIAAVAAISIPPMQVSAQPSVDLGERIDQAGKALDDKISRCAPVDLKQYEDLYVEANRIFKAALKVGSHKVPFDQVHVDNAHRAQDLLNRAREAATKCSPKNGGTSFIYGDTKVEPPKIAPVAPTDQYKGVPPPQLGNDALARDYAREFGNALERYLAAKKRCDMPGMQAARAEMDAAAVRTKAALEAADNEGKFKGTSGNPAIDVPKWMEEKRKQAEAGPVGMCARPSNIALSVFASRILAEHNRERAYVGAPPLEWDERLAHDAEGFAQQLARTGQLAHAPREGRGIARENLSQGMLGWNVSQMMGNWFKEKRNFKVGVYPDVSVTGDWADVSHYTQVIWPTTTDLGCGMASGAGSNWLVCRYSPGGNRDGKPVPGLPEVKVAGQASKSADFDSPFHTPGLNPIYHAPYFSALDPEQSARPSKSGQAGQSYEPNQTVINLLGDGLIYGNVDGPALKGIYDPANNAIAYTTDGAEPSCQVAGEYIPPGIDLVRDLYLPPTSGGGEQQFLLEMKYTIGDGTLSNVYQDTKVVQPELGGQETFDPAKQPEFIIIQTEPYMITVTPTKISDCVM